MRGLKTAERIERILELPKLIDTTGRRLVALRAEKRGLEAKLKKREVTVRYELMSDEEYKACANQGERDTVYLATLHADPNWEGISERLEQLAVAIDLATHEKDVYDHERKALKAVLEREYAEIIERLLTDRMLAETIMKHHRVSVA